MLKEENLNNKFSFLLKFSLFTSITMYDILALNVVIGGSSMFYTIEKKGFTLIELLAVILIIGIIALIAIPTVNKIISQAKISSIETTIDGYIKAIENKISISQLLGETTFQNRIYTVNELDLDIKGKIPSSGWVMIKNDEIINYSFLINKYIASYGNKVKIGSELLEIPYKSFAIGEEVTFDAGDGVIRTWNVIKESSAAETELVVLLNSNYVEYCDWSTSSVNPNTTNADKAKSLLPSTSVWSNVSNIRLISAQEVANIAGLSSWTPSGSIVNINLANFGWLVANTYGRGDNNNIGYWTDTAFVGNTNNSWYISNTPSISLSNAYYSVANAKYIGIRPVVTVPKTIVITN